MNLEENKSQKFKKLFSENMFHTCMDKQTSSKEDFPTFFNKAVLKIKLTGMQLSLIVLRKNILDKSFKLE